MAYTNSSLVTYTKLTKHHSGLRTHSIDRITPHCVVGQWTAKKIADYFYSTTRDASCNYGIGKDGDISLCVEEKNRSWCSSSNANDQRAITIECASDTKDPYEMSDAVYNSLVNLCVDICKRNGKSKLLWLNDKTKSLNYTPANDEMVLTVHRWFANKSCPGNWLYSRLGDLAKTVTKKLNNSNSETSKSNYLYRVQAGAYKWKLNATIQLNKVKNKGFDAVIINENNLYKVQVGAYKNISNADKQLAKLKAAGIAATIITINNSLKSIDEIAKEVIEGKWGNGETRKRKLTEAGYDYAKVQARVNELMK